MNPIEEMMEKYGVERPKEMPYACLQRLQPYNCLGCMKYDEDKKECTIEGDYPDFTPEKQIEIYQMIAPKATGLTIFLDEEQDWVFIIDEEYVGFNKDYVCAFAMLLKNIHCALTPTQRQKIKEVLER
ncbi:MAG: hypothetical protein NC191_09990 [Muribaculaceae bacterium]|nr:hypothetical protein [Muribaculaceae bacterium]